MPLTFRDAATTSALDVDSNNPLPVSAVGERQVTATGLSTTAAPYVAGNLVGTKLSFADAVRAGVLTGLLQSVFLLEKGTQKAPMELLIFNADPTATTFTDKAAFTVNAADVDKIIRRITISSTDYVTVGGVSIVDLSPGSRVVSGTTTTLYGALVTTGTPTYLTVADLILRLGFIRD